MPHLDEDTKRQLLARTPPYLRDARSKGTPSLGAGAIYPIPESDITVPTAPIPPHWKRSYAMDVGWNRTAALWGAEDPETGNCTLYSEYYKGQAVPSVHADAIRSRGKWMKGASDPAARGRSQKDGEQLFATYQELGLDLVAADNGVEAGIYDVWQMLESGRLKVQQHLVNWFAEYRLYRRDEKGHIVKKNDHLMDTTRYWVRTGRKIATYRPVDAIAGGMGGGGIAGRMGY